MRGLFEGAVLGVLFILMSLVCVSNVSATEVSSVKEVAIEVSEPLAMFALEGHGLSQEEVFFIVDNLPEEISKTLPKGYGVYMFNSVKVSKSTGKYYIILDFVPII